MRVNYLSAAKQTLLVLLLSVTTVVEARMYQWTDPDVKTTQLSGTPPAWYRSVARGPRVFVFAKGRLIDDTAIEVTEETRQRMRQQAFALVKKDRQKAQEKMAQAKKLQQKYEKEKLDKPESNSEAHEITTDSTENKRDEKDEL